MHKFKEAFVRIKPVQLEPPGDLHLHSFTGPITGTFSCSQEHEKVPVMELYSTITRRIITVADV